MFSICNKHASLAAKIRKYEEKKSFVGSATGGNPIK